MKKRRLFHLSIFASFCLSAAALTSAGPAGKMLKTSDVPAEDTTLKGVYKPYFFIGAAINASQIQEKSIADTRLLEGHFNSITPENIMKSAIIHPGWNQYDFALADQFVAFGKKHGMYIVGHTLVWHSQLSPFAEKIRNRDSMQQFLRTHIETVAGRYAGKINCWDVVNEALEEDGSLRKSVFLEQLGEGYLLDAFRYAAKAAPDAALYYNDYNIEQPQKRQGVISIVNKLRAAGLRIDGVGIQGHWSINGLPLKDIEESILAFAAMGLRVSITELDLTVLPNPWDLKGAEVSQQYENNARMNPYPQGLPDSVQQKLADAYGQLFRIFLKHQDKIERVTFWGAHDAQSWLNGWPIKGRVNYPLLFDRNLKPKPAFYRVLEVARNQHN